jgi:hypothetical protein
VTGLARARAPEPRAAFVHIKVEDSSSGEDTDGDGGGGGGEEATGGEGDVEREEKEEAEEEVEEDKEDVGQQREQHSQTPGASYYGRMVAGADALTPGNTRTGEGVKAVLMFSYALDRLQPVRPHNHKPGACFGKLGKQLRQEAAE